MYIVNKTDLRITNGIVHFTIDIVQNKIIRDKSLK